MPGRRNARGMKFFILSLKGSERLPKTLANLARFEIRPEVRLGIRGSTLPPSRLEEMVFHHPARDLLLRRLTPGEIGCSLSHFLTMHQIVKAGIPRAFILEDDVHFNRDPREAIVALEQWTSGRSNYAVNWGGQRDPRFSLPLALERHQLGPGLAIHRFPDMLWGSYCILVDREYCVEHLRRAFPLLYIFDVYGMLRLRSASYVVSEENPTCDPEDPGEPVLSTIEPRPPSLLSRVFPRGTMPRYRLEQLRDSILWRLARDKFWSLDRTQEYLDNLEPLCAAGPDDQRTP